MAELGRQIKYGIGIETVAGTAVPATKWINQLSFELNPISTYATNNAAWGNIVKTNGADVLRTHTEGKLEAKLTDITSGYFLLGAFGSVSSASNADASGLVFDHTFSINENINGKSFTLVRKDGIATEAFALARMGKWELSMKLDDYITYSADIIAKKGASTTATVAYVEEAEFVPKHITVKTAADLAGLTGATAQTTVESFTLTVDPSIEIDWESGSADPAGITSRGYEASFEMTCRYNDTIFQDAYKNGTALALQITALNSDVTIGTTAKPKLVITSPKMNITDWTRKEDLDSPLTQTMTGTIHYSPADAKAITAVLTNKKATYIA